MEIGLYPGVNALEYHRWTGASQSRLKVLRDKSPAHLRWQMDHPEEQTDAMRLGAAVHTCVLEPDLFPCVYVRAIEGDGRTKAIKDARTQQALDNPGATILPADDFDTCLAIRDSVGRHPSAKHLLAGERERSAIWTDPETGVRCRGRFDDIAREFGAITDLKTCMDASPNRFPRDLYIYGYHIQAAMYLRGAVELGLGCDTFGFVAVEKEPPYAVAVYQLAAPAIHDGVRELNRLLAIWAQCEASGEWPGYDTNIVTIDLPGYAPAQITERIGAAA